MKDHVLLHLINRIPKKKRGRIKNYEKFFDPSIGYYGVRRKEGAEVTGFILLDITEDELKIFDYFEDEGELYHRIKTKAYDEDGREYEVFLYVRDV